VNLSRDFDSVQAREVDVQQNQIRLQFRRFLNGFQSVRDFADDLQIWPPSHARTYKSLITLEINPPQ
jgi:hypothetical protein